MKQLDVDVKPTCFCFGTFIWPYRYYSNAWGQKQTLWYIKCQSFFLVIFSYEFSYDVDVKPTCFSFGTFIWPYRYYSNAWGQKQTLWYIKCQRFFLVLFSYELLSSDFWYSDRQKDGKRCRRAHSTLADMSTVPISAGLSRFWPHCPAVPPIGTMSRQRTVSAAFQLLNFSNRTIIKGDMAKKLRWLLKHNFPNVDRVVSLSTLHYDSRDLKSPLSLRLIDPRLNET